MSTCESNSILALTIVILVWALNCTVQTLVQDTSSSLMYLILVSPCASSRKLLQDFLCYSICWFFSSLSHNITLLGLRITLTWASRAAVLASALGCLEMSLMPCCFLLPWGTSYTLSLPWKLALQLTSSLCNMDRMHCGHVTKKRHLSDKIFFIPF